MYHVSRRQRLAQTANEESKKQKQSYAHGFFWLLGEARRA
jgi:hypothetical protein